MNAADSVVVIEAGETASSPAAAASPIALGDVVADARPAPGADLPANWPPRAALQPSGNVILGLQYPVRFKLRDASGVIRDGDTYEELNLGRLKGKHKVLLAKTADRVGFEKAILGCSTGLDAGKMELLYGEMDQSDIAAALIVMDFFIRPGPRTGPAS